MNLVFLASHKEAKPQSELEYRKFGGETCARSFKRLVRAAYWPRWIAASIVRPFRPQIAAQQKIFRHLLDDLTAM